MVGSVSSCLSEVDKYCDHLPIVRSLTNLWDIFFKAVVLSLMSENVKKANPYFCRLDQKSYETCTRLISSIMANIFFKSGNTSKLLVVEDFELRTDKDVGYQNSKKKVIIPPEKSIDLPPKEIGKLITEASPFESKNEEIYKKRVSEYQRENKVIDNKEELLTLLKENPLLIEVASDLLKKDKDVALSNVRNDGYALMYQKEFQDDDEVVLASVEINGMSLRYASERLRSDKSIVLAAVKNDPQAKQYASEELKKDYDILKTTALHYGFVNLPDDLRNDRDFALAIVKHDANRLDKAGKFKEDKEFVMEVVKIYGKALQYASKGLQNDREVVLEAMKKDLYAFNYASKALQNDEKLLAMYESNNSGSCNVN